MTVGNGIISGMNRGLENNIINGFMGDIAVISDREKTDNILFKMFGESISVLPEYRPIKEVLLRGAIHRALPSRGQET
jgi:hypothetical protein